MPDVPATDVRAWIDRLAITDLIHRYSDAVTRADWAQCEPLYAPDAVWESPLLDMHFDGARAFLDFLAASTRNLDVLIQTASSPVVRLDGDRASATTSIREIIRGVTTADDPSLPPGTPRSVDQYGVYYDDLARRDGRWCFVHRVFVPVLVIADGPAGQVVANRGHLSTIAQTAR
jgi:hypothetical protein